MNENLQESQTLESLSVSNALGIENMNEIFTIDPFIDTNQYNQALEALKNNKIEYEESIYLKTPYYFYLRLSTKQTPVLMNYEMISRSRWNYLVTKVKPLQSKDILKLYRFDTNVSSIRSYINNDAFSESLKAEKTIIFNYKNREQLINLSKNYGKIYVLGKYVNNKYRLAMCFDSQIKNVLMPNEVYIAAKDYKLGQLELEINNEIFKNKEKIIKWTQTPYFKDGKYFPTSPVSPIKI